MIHLVETQLPVTKRKVFVSFLSENNMLEIDTGAYYSKQIAGLLLYYIYSDTNETLVNTMKSVTGTCLTIEDRFNEWYKTKFL